MKWLLITALVLIIGAPLAQTTHAKDRGIHGLAAFSTNFSFPGSIRVGWGDWELGKLTPFTYGFDKIFDFNDYTYATLGFAYSSNLGLYGGVGFCFSVFRIGIRGELTTFFDISGMSQGLGIIGVTYGF